MKFRDWLSRQKDRQDQVGRLARALADRDIKYYSKRRKRDEHKKWADIVTRYGTPVHVLSFNRAWKEFLKAKSAKVEVNGEDGEA